MSQNKFKQYCEDISDTCFVKAESSFSTGILFFKKGKLVIGSLNGEYGKDIATVILNWQDVNPVKIDIESVTKFASEDLLYMLDLIELADINADLYIKSDKMIYVLSFSNGCLVTVMPEKDITKEFILDLTSLKGKSFKMKLTGEKTGDIKIYISELLT